MNRLRMLVASDWDAEFVAKRLRPADTEELQASEGIGMDPVEVVLDAYRKSKLRWVGVDRSGIPVIVFGFTHLNSTTACPWLLATPEIENFKGAMLEQIRPYIDLAHETYPTLINAVYAESHAAVRWIQYLGFDISEPFKFGPDDKLFRMFREVHHV